MPRTRRIWFGQKDLLCNRGVKSCSSGIISLGSKGAFASQVATNLIIVPRRCLLWICINSLKGRANGRVKCVLFGCLQLCQVRARQHSLGRRNLDLHLHLHLHS